MILEKHLRAFVSNAMINYHPANRQRVTTRVTKLSFRTADFFQAVNYMYRKGGAADGISYPTFYDFNKQPVHDPLGYAEQLNKEILRLRRDVPFWKVAVSPEFGFLVNDLTPKVIEAFRAYMQRRGHDAILLGAEHNDTALRHVHLVIPEVYRGWDKHRHKTYISYHIPQYRLTRTLPFRLGVNLIRDLGRRPDIPTLNHVAHEMRWTPIDDRIRYRMSKDRILDLNPAHRTFKTVYDQIEHLEEVKRMKFLMKSTVRMVELIDGHKNVYKILPSHDEILYSLKRSSPRLYVFHHARKYVLSLDELRSRGFRLDTRLVPPGLEESRYDFDMRHSTSFYRGVSFAQLELNRDIEFQKVVALSYIPVDPLAPYVRANQVILVDRRTGLIRIARFGDIDPDKGHLLTPAYDAYRSERNINGSYREVNITEFQRLQGVDDDFKAKLEIEADFWRRWRFYLDHQEDKIEKYLVKRQQKVEHKQERELERTNERNLTPEQAVHREVTLDFAQSVSQKESHDRDLELEGGLQLGSDDF